MANKLVPTLTKAHSLIKEGNIKVADLVERCFSNIKARDNLNAFLSVRD